LPPRRRTWCSDRCGDAFWNNHWWSQARSAAKRRDKYRCIRCGHIAPKRPTRVRFPNETAYRAAARAWRAGRAENRLEVNHLSPALGAHGALSCVHHLENLETLCVACHKAFTSETRPRRATELNETPAKAQSGELAQLRGVPPVAPPKRVSVRRAMR
jgi:hypothetical protein